MSTPLEIIQSILVGHLGLDTPPSPGATLEDLGADSLDHVEIAMAVEEEFQIELSDQEVDRITTVQDILDLLHTKGVG